LINPNSPSNTEEVSGIAMLPVLAITQAGEVEMLSDRVVAWFGALPTEAASTGMDSTPNARLKRRTKFDFRQRLNAVIWRGN
jgi:hypothetical protein